jgi:hypothetical protein
MTVWTDAEDDKLRSMRKDGKSFDYCARHLPGRNRSACLGRAHRLKLPAVTPDVAARRSARTAAARRPRLPAAGTGAPPRSLDDREHAIDDLCLMALDQMAAGWTARETAEHLGITAGELAALWAEVQADAAQEEAA